MIGVNCTDFLFHPLSESHSTLTKILAVITNIALTALTFGLYLFLFAYVRCMETRQVTYVSAPAKEEDAVDGTAELKSKLIDHLGKLEQLASQDLWKHIASHTAHPDSAFDWWMFPSDKPSRGQGYRYTVTADDIVRLKKDPAFMQAYCSGVELVLLSWGWDAAQSKPIANPHPDQHWTGYKIRLEKMVYSLRLFGMDQLSVRRFIQAHKISLAPWAQ